MPTVTSRDGTTIDYDIKGRGPVLVFVAGALQHRAVDQTTSAMADDLAGRFTVIDYDRRGRGQSTDNAPYTTQKEIEDIEALIDAHGGSAGIYGLSSGAVLALEATAALPGKVTGALLYEPPIDPQTTPAEYLRRHTEMAKLCEKGDREAMLSAFMKSTGISDQGLEAFRQSPAWVPFAYVGLTLEHDYRILADAREIDDPPSRWTNIAVPVLVVNGDASFPFMDAGAAWVAAAVPGAQRRTLAGQSHEFDPKVLGPVIGDFFAYLL